MQRRVEEREVDAAVAQRRRSCRRSRTRGSRRARRGGGRRSGPAAARAARRAPGRASRSTSAPPRRGPAPARGPARRRPRPGSRARRCSSASPAGVSSTRRVLRTSSGPPSSASSRRICGRQRGLREVQPGGGAREVQLLGDGDEIAQLAQLHRCSNYRATRIIVRIFLLHRVAAGHTMPPVTRRGESGSRSTASRPGAVATARDRARGRAPRRRGGGALPGAGRAVEDPRRPPDLPQPDRGVRGAASRRSRRTS